MDNFYDYTKFAVLYVDDEEKSLKYFTRAFEDRFRIFTASNAKDGYRILEENKDSIALLLTDQQMPGEKGVQLLEKARQLRPRILRFLVTAYSDLDAAIDAVNSGSIYKYISKPWDVTQLEVTLRRAMEFFIVQRERDHLLREKMSVLHNLMITDRVVSLGILAAGLGHHIRNALVAIRTFLDLAPAKLEEEQVDLDELRNPNFWKDFYTHVQSQVGRITDLLSDLGGAVARSEPCFDFQAGVAEEIRRGLANLGSGFQAKRIAVDQSIPADLPRLRVDEVKFRRFIDLLLSDEMASLPEGSTLKIRASTVPAEPNVPPEVLLEFQDNGPGLPESSLRSVFDPFFIRHDDPKEFGVRLMTCFFIIYHHGGRIEVRSRPGEGTLFRIHLPVNPEAQTPRQEDEHFVTKVLLNEAIWEKLLSGG